MAFFITIDRLDANIEEITVGPWLKSPGDPVTLGEPVVEIITDKITFEYESADGPVTALRDVGFSVDSSEFLCVVGQSGCGKTTLLNLVAGVLGATQGGGLIRGPHPH